jgi:osmotically inducible lipoprotein OsmB
MKRSILAVTCAALLAVAACEDMSRDEQMIVGGLVGGAVGLVTANALDANHNWTIVAVLAGAAVGSLVARNNATNECAYAAGNGKYRILPCR